MMGIPRQVHPLHGTAMRLRPEHPDEIRDEPRQPLDRERFGEALALHGFAAIVTPFGIQFLDRRRGRRFGAAIGATSADGSLYLDRLATLRELLALRRAADELAARRRAAVRRVLGWLLAPAPAAVRVDRRTAPGD